MSDECKDQAVEADYSIDPTDVQIVVNLPFCKRACRHCDKTMTYAPGDDLMKAYVRALLREIVSLAPDMADHRVSCVHITGGMPLMLPQGELKDILTSIKQSFALCENAEILLDTHPGLLKKDRLADCVEAGINRISLSLVSTNYKEFRQINPPFDVGDFQSSAWLMRTEGFRAFEIRIPVGLPFQTKESLRSTVFEATGMGPVGAAYIPFVLRTGTPLGDAYQAGEHLGMPGPQTREALFEEATNILWRDGYRATSLVSYAFPGHQSINELHHVAAGQVLGLGAGATTCCDGYEYTNTSDIDLYIAHANEPEQICQNIYELAEKPAARRAALCALDGPDGVILSDFETRFGMPLHDALPQTDALIEAGLLEQKDNRLVKTARGVVDIPTFEQIMAN